MDIAIVGVGAAVQLDASGKSIVSARIALGAVAATPVYAQKASELLAGKAVSDEVIQQAAHAARDVISPIRSEEHTS